MKTAEQIAAEKAALAAAQSAADESTKAKALIADAVAVANAPLLEATKGLVESMKTFLDGQSRKPTTENMKGLVEVPAAFDHRPAVTGEEVAKGQGIAGVRVMRAAMSLLLDGNRNGISPEGLRERLKAWGHEREAHAVEINARTKAMNMTTFADGGALVPQEFSAEIIALLRNKAAIRALGARVVPMGASLEMPEQTGASTAYWLGETTTITDSTPQLGTQKLSEKKLGALVAFSNDLFRNSSVAADEFIRNDLVNVIALKEDSTGLFSAGGEYSPRGLTSQTLAANQVNSTAASQVAPTLAEIRTELGKCVQRIAEGNIPMIRMGWIFNPRTWRYLWSITDGNGNAVYQQEMNTGRLLGHPYVMTNQIGNNLTWSVDGSADVSAIFFGDFEQFILGESMQLQIELFPNAAITLGGSVVSGISTDRSAIRALKKMDMLLRYNRAFTIVKTRMGA